MTRVREWKPGDIGITGGDPGKDPQTFIVQQGPIELRFVYDDGSTLLHPPREDARPLVVIDLESDDVERLASLFISQYDCLVGGGIDAMQAALREFADPKPRIEEPTGLGAVVLVDEFDQESRWCRSRSHEHGINWRQEFGGRWSAFADLNVVRVLSEGVTA